MNLEMKKLRSEEEMQKIVAMVYYICMYGEEITGEEGRWWLLPSCFSVSRVVPAT